MTEARWKQLVADLQQVDSVDRAVAAAENLLRESGTEDVPRLRALLKDESFFVREAAAWPLSDLGAVIALPELLQALQRGHDEGHDNDGLCSALADLAEGNAAEAFPILKQLAVSDDAALRERAAWLLQFCSPRDH